MSVYLVNIFLITGYAAFLRTRDYRFFNKKYSGNALFCFFAGLNWIIISGFRSVYVGPDTYTYGESYSVTATDGWSYLINRFVNIYTTDIPGKDPGYDIFVKFTQIFFYNYQGYLFLVGLLFVVPFSRWVYRYSSDVYISFFIYSILFFSFFSITGIRQTIATALVVLVGYELIVKRKIFMFILTVLLGCFFHKSALMFFPFYYLYNMRINRYYFVFFFILAFLLFVFRFEYSAIAKVIGGYDEYGVYDGAGTNIFSLAMILVGVVCFWRLQNILALNARSNHFINAYLISMLLLPLSYVNPSAMRVVQYYSIFILLLIPEIIKSFDRKYKLYIYFSVLAALFLLFTKAGTGGSYAFFWDM